MNKPIYKHLYWSSLILKLKAGWFLAATIYIYMKKVQKVHLSFVQNEFVLFAEVF
jgi:hypothetical protein